MSFLRSIAKEALDHVVSVTKYLCCLHIANTYACTLTLVSGPSMLPTLNLTGDLLLVERVSPKLGKVRPGDVVLVKSPVEPRKNLAKRVIALEGDQVTSFVDPLTSDHSQTVVVPRGHVWIQGDNLYASRDSRHYGPVPYGLIQGKVFCRLWPLDSFGSLDTMRLLLCQMERTLSTSYHRPESSQGFELSEKKRCDLQIPVW